MQLFFYPEVSQHRLHFAEIAPDKRNRKSLQPLPSSLQRLLVLVEAYQAAAVQPLCKLKAVTAARGGDTMDQFMSGAFINKKKERGIAQKYVDSLKTKTPNVDQLVVNLSGGNQQKVVIAKWLVRNCDILIFDEPTRGIDVGAKSEIYHLMNELVAAGKSIIMISSEMTEILRMSDRIIVMCEGRVTGEIGIEEATQERIMHAATLRK